MDISSPNNVKLMEAVVKAAEDLETAIACGDPILSAARARLRAAVQIFRDHNTSAALDAVLPVAMAQERERIAATVDCDCAHKADVLAVRNENSGDRWRACGRDPCGALQARAIRQEPGHE